MRMVQELREQDPGDKAVISRVARQLGVGDESLRSWVKQAEIDAGSARWPDHGRAGRARELRKENASCAAPTTSCRPRQVSSGRSSTADKRSSRLHRRPPGQETGGRRWGVEPICEGCSSPPPPTTTPSPGRRRPGPSVTPSSGPSWSSCGSTTTRSTDGASSTRRPGVPATTSAGPGGPAHAPPGHPRGQPGQEALHHQVRPDRGPGPRPRERNFSASRPDALWVADFTYCSTWSGIVYVAFVIDVFSRRLVGWKAARSMTATLVLDALNMAAWTRRHTTLDGLICHTDAGSQYTSIALHRTARRRRRRTLHRDRRRQLRQRHGRIGHGTLQDRAAPQPRRPGRQRRALEGTRRPRDRHLRLGVVVQRWEAQRRADSVCHQ